VKSTQKITEAIAVLWFQERKEVKAGNKRAVRIGLGDMFGEVRQCEISSLSDSLGQQYLEAVAATILSIALSLQRVCQAVSTIQGHKKRHISLIPTVGILSPLWDFTENENGSHVRKMIAIGAVSSNKSLIRKKSFPLKITESHIIVTHLNLLSRSVHLTYIWQKAGWYLFACLNSKTSHLSK
jgi:hypothetical protein